MLISQVLSPSIEALEASHPLLVIVGEPYPSMAKLYLSKPARHSSSLVSSSRRNFPHSSLRAFMRLLMFSRFPESRPSTTTSAECILAVSAHLDLLAVIPNM